MRFAYNPYRVPPSPADWPLIDPRPKNQWIFIYRPDLKVLVAGSGRRAKEVSILGLVDIGSTECILPYEVAEQVDPKWLGSGEIRDYAGGVHAVRYGRVHLQFRIEKERLRWPAVVAFSRDRSSEALWGRRGFLDYFSITFNGPDKYFIIRLRDPVPSWFTVHRVPRRKPRGSEGSDLITPSDQNP